MVAALGQRLDVVNVGGRHGQALACALNTEWMLAELHHPDAAPARIIATLGGGATLGVNLLVALLVGLALMLGAARAGSYQGSTPRVTTPPLCFGWHGRPF